MGAFAALQFGLAPALASALLHALWQDALLGLGAWFALAATARSSAAVRHAIGMGFLLAMVLVPASTFMNFWQVPITAVEGSLRAVATAPGTASAGRVFEHTSSPVAIVLALIWLLGVALMLLRQAGGWHLLRMLEKQPFESLPNDWQHRVTGLAKVMRIGREVSVRLSNDFVGPCTARLLRPVIWLPLSLLTQLPREQAEALLAHELAHVARMDWLWNGLQCIAESLLFFHPAAWWLGRRIRAEREHACDDLAVAACGDAIALAEALVQLERHRQPVPRLVLAAHGGSLMKRIKRLLSASSSRAPWGARAGIATVLVAGSLLVVQVGMAASGRPGLQVRSTAEGVLGPGDMREITTRGIDGERYYRAEVDPSGRLVEIYEHNGKRAPLNAAARGWLAGITRLTVPPAPPSPPSPPSPASPPSPPSAADVPPPPTPPEISDSVEFQSLLSLVAADPGVHDALGVPVVLAATDVEGHIEIGEGASPDGDADLGFDLAGPKGRATVRVDAQLKNGTWSLEHVQLARQSR